jgi:hypothetical protein
MATHGLAHQVLEEVGIVLRCQPVVAQVRGQRPCRTSRVSHFLDDTEQNAFERVWFRIKRNQSFQNVPPHLGPGKIRLLVPCPLPRRMATGGEQQHSQITGTHEMDLTPWFQVHREP